MNDSNPVSQTTYRVLYGDVDQMGVVYYSNYFRLFERGRAEFMRQRGLPYKVVEERGIILPVTEAHCHYHSSARYDDLLLIETQISSIKRASVHFTYQIFNGEDKSMKLVEGWTRHACLSPNRRVVRLPEFLIKSLSQAPDQP